VELRNAVRSKMSEQEGLSHMSELRKELRDLAPFMSEAMSRVEANVRQKAEASDLQKIQDDMDVLNRTTGRPKQLLVGTKCLACDRQVSSADATDRGPLSLIDRKQEGDLWNEVQRTLDKQPGTKDVLKYVAIHVGTPTRVPPRQNTAERRPGRDEIFDGRETSDTSGGHYLMRMGGGGGVTRPQTQPIEGCPRSPPREATPLVRVAPRRIARHPAGASAPATPRDTARRLQSTTMRSALGIGVPGSGSATAPAPPPSIDTLGRESPASPQSLVRMQPAAHSGVQQQSATDRYDPYGIDDSPPESRALSPVS